MERESGLFKETPIRHGVIIRKPKGISNISALQEIEINEQAGSRGELNHAYPVWGDCSVQLNRSVVPDSLRPHELQHTRPPCPSPLPEFTKTHVHGVGDAIQPSHPLASPSPPAPNPSQHQSLFQWVNSSHEVVKVLKFQLQHHSLKRNPRADLLQNGQVGCPCSPRESQESSPTPQFKSISSSVLSFVHSLTLTSIYDYRKNHSLD